jgi:dolichol-phosphate mannosyltransferase
MEIPGTAILRNNLIRLQTFPAFAQTIQFHRLWEGPRPCAGPTRRTLQHGCAIRLDHVKRELLKKVTECLVCNSSALKSEAARAGQSMSPPKLDMTNPNTAIINTQDQLRLSGTSLGIVCPMANEGEDAARFVVAVLGQCAGFRRVQFFAVFDHATTDNSFDLMRALARSEPRLSVIWAAENRCAVDAYIRGYREALEAGCDWILEIDAGFSHQPEDIPQFFSKMQEGYDCVFGSRFMKGGRISQSSLERYFVSRMGTILTNLLIGTRLHDMTSGFEVFSRHALEMVLRKGIVSRGHFFQTEIKVYCRHLRITEVPIHYKAASPRLGASSLRDAFSQLWRLYRMRRYRLFEETL